MKVLSVSERVGSDRLGSFGIYLGFARRIIGELNSDVIQALIPKLNVAEAL